MGLEDGFDLLSGDLTAIINRIEGLREGFATLRTFEALIALCWFDRACELSGGRSRDIASCIT
jgi:hypothetical protein